MKTQSPRVLTHKDTKQSPKKLSEFEKLVQVCKVTTQLFYQQNSQKVSKRSNIGSVRCSVFDQVGPFIEKNWGKKPIQDSKGLVCSTSCISREELFKGSMLNVGESSSGRFCKLKIKRSGGDDDYLEGKKAVKENDNNGYFLNKKSDPFVEEKAFDGVRGKKRSRKCFDLSKDDQDFEYSEKEKKPIQDFKDLVGSTCCISPEELFNGSIPNFGESSSGSFCKLKIKRSGDNYDYLEGKKVVEGNDNNGYFLNKKSDPFVEEKAFDGVRGKKRSRKCFDLSKDDQDFEYSEKEKKPRTICNARPKVFKVASPLPVVLKNEIQGMRGTDIKLIIQKNLFSADTDCGQNRFSIPMKQIREKFLTDEEESILDQRFKDNHVVPLMVPLIAYTLGARVD